MGTDKGDERKRTGLNGMVAERAVLRCPRAVVGNDVIERKHCRWSLVSRPSTAQVFVNSVHLVLKRVNGHMEEQYIYITNATWWSLDLRLVVHL